MAFQPFASSMFPHRLGVRRAGDAISPQGGVSPSPGVATWYPAIVQWKNQAALESNPETPLAKTDAMIFIPRTGPDPLLSGLLVGDQVDIDEDGEITVGTVQDTPVGATGSGRTWGFPIKVVYGS